jgi:hypothetical protein
MGDHKHNRGNSPMKKYDVQYARIEHQVYFLEVEAENEDQARELAREQFTGDEDFRVVHAEEFINQVEEVAP